MPGLLSLEIAKSGLFSNQRALDVTGQNIANVNNDDYHKQRVVMEATSPLFPLGFPGATTARQLGTGVEITQIQRLRDLLLERRLREETTDFSKFDKEFDLLHQVELIYNEPTDNSLRARADEFWSSLQDLANHPEDIAVRAAVRERAVNLADIVNQESGEFIRLGGAADDTAVNQEIRAIVDDLNADAKKIAQLSKQIQVQEAAGHNPNDLLDQRDGLVKKIANLVDVQVSDPANDNFLVTVSGLALAQGSTASEFEAKFNDDQKLGIYVKGTSTRLLPDGGELKALFNFRDVQLQSHLDSLADFAATLINKFNDLHKNSFGLDGSTNVNFWQPFETKSDGVYKITGTKYVSNPDLALNGGLYGTVKVSQTNAVLNGSINFNGILDGDVATAGTQTAGVLTFNDINNNSDLNSDGNTAGDSGDTTAAPTVDYDLTTDTLESIVNKINLNVFGAAVSTPLRTGALAKIVDGKIVINGVYSVTDTGNLLGKLGVTPEKENFENTNVNGTTYTGSAGEFRIGKGKLDINKYTIDYDGNVDSLQDVAKRVNDLRMGILAEVDSQNRLTLRGTSSSDFKISELSDSGNLLERLGILQSSTTFESTFPLNDSGTDYSMVAANQAYLDKLINNTSRGFIGQGFLAINGIDIFSKTTADAAPGTANDIIYNGVDTIPAPATLPGRAFDTLGVSYFGISLEGLATAINAAAAANPVALSGVTASVTVDNRLVVTGVTSWRDTGDLTQALRIVPRSKTFMTGDATSEAYIVGKIDQPPVDNFAFKLDISTEIKNDLRKIAAAGGIDMDKDGVNNLSRGPGNGDNALAMAALKSSRIMDNNSATTDQFFGGMISSLGIAVQLADTNRNTQKDVIANIDLLNKSISGVSLDEEMVNLMKYQRAYQASAKHLNTADQMLQTLFGLGS